MVLILTYSQRYTFSGLYAKLWTQGNFSFIHNGGLISENTEMSFNPSYVADILNNMAS